MGTQNHHGLLQAYFADTRAGQVGFYGTLEEHGHRATLGLRLKIENRSIGEMEALMLRSTARGTFSDVAGLKDRPIMSQTLAPSERRSRDELITAANAYFEGMEQGHRQIHAVAARNSRLDLRSSITKVQDRRFPVVDEERGLVWAFVRFDHAGKDKTITYNDGSVHR